MKIPSDWEKKLISDISNVVRGGSPRPAGSSLYFNGDFLPWITVKEVTKDTSMYLTKTKSFLTKAGSEKTRIIDAGTFILTNSGATLGVPKITQLKAGANDGIAMILNPEGVTKQHLYYFFESLTRFLREHAAPGNGQPNLNTEIIGSLPILLPPLPEQKAIADLLSTWDKAIEKTERLIQSKEKRYKGDIQRLIAHKCSGWAHIKPKKIFDAISEKNFPDEELLSVTQDRGVIPRNMLEGRVMSPDGTRANYKRIKAGDFAISLRSFQGGIEFSSYQGIISPAYTVLRPKLDINTEFYRLFFKSYLFIEKYLNLAVIGIRDGKQISVPDFLGVKIPLPPVKEQRQITEILSTAQREIDLLKQLTTKYKAQKSGLMQKLLTGKWRVRPEIISKYTEE